MIVFFVYNILIFNYKDTKNYRDYQLFKRISYPELRFKDIDAYASEHMSTNWVTERTKILHRIA